MSHGADKEAVVFSSRSDDDHGFEARGSCHCAPEETVRLASAKRAMRALNLLTPIASRRPLCGVYWGGECDGVGWVGLDPRMCEVVW